MVHRENDFGLNMKNESDFCLLGKQVRRKEPLKVQRSNRVSLYFSGVQMTLLKKKLCSKICPEMVLYLSSICKFRIQPESLKSSLLAVLTQ